MLNWRVSRDAALVISRCGLLWLIFPTSAFDELVGDTLLLKDFLVCHSSHILQPKTLCVFHFDERTTNELKCSLLRIFYEMMNF